jgi:hypothetical protein
MQPLRPARRRRGLGRLLRPFAPLVDWSDDVGPDYCPDCATAGEACLIARQFGGLLLHLTSLQDPTILRGDPTPTAEIDAFIDARLGGGDPR